MDGTFDNIAEGIEYQTNANGFKYQKEILELVEVSRIPLLFRLH